MQWVRKLCRRPERGWVSLLRPDAFARGPSRPQARLTLETLEPRDVPSAGGVATDSAVVPIGVNVAENIDWATDAKWVNVIHQFRFWGRHATPSTPDHTIPLTADGYPLVDAGTVSNLFGYPAGTYHLSYRGTATLTFRGLQASATHWRTVNNVTTADVSLNPPPGPSGGGSLTILVSGVDPANPLDNLSLITPGYTSRQVFTDEFLHRLQPFSVLRFMDMTATNFSPVQHWNERTKPNDFWQSNQGTMPHGVAWEYVIDLANVARKDLWINIPYQAAPDYVSGLANKLRDMLDPGRTVYVEFSNEVWNFAFGGHNPNGQYNLNQQAAQADGGWFQSLGLNPGQWPDAEYAKRLVQTAQVFRRVFGDTRYAQQVRPVLAGQTVNVAHVRNGLTFIERAYGNPADYLGGVAIAPYLDLTKTGVDDNDNLTLDNLFAGLNIRLTNAVGPGIDAHGQLACSYGLPLYAYEGGQHLVPLHYQSGTPNYEVKVEAQGDPRMGQLLRDLIGRWVAGGGGTFNYYNDIGPYGSFGYWGLLQRIGEPGSVKWDTILSLALPGGDATLDGTVDYADFVVLRDHYGTSGQWWEQGDFNGDHVVDAQDFCILYRNLSGLDPAHQAEVDQFALDHGIDCSGAPAGRSARQQSAVPLARVEEAVVPAVPVPTGRAEAAAQRPHEGSWVSTADGRAERAPETVSHRQRVALLAAWLDGKHRRDGDGAGEPL